MCIYCGTTKYRKIYENHIGPIPKDVTGRTYDIHHLDGDRTNNGPSNLAALSIQEHYDIHYRQSDFGACLLIGRKMTMPAEILSELNRARNLQQVINGTHPWQTRPDGTNVQTDRVTKGTHPWQTRPDGSNHNIDRVLNKTHNLLKREDGSSVSKTKTLIPGYVNPISRKPDGTSPFAGRRHHSYDHTIYGFRHKDTGEEVFTTRHDFYTSHKLESRNVNKMVRGAVRTVKGWQLITTPSK